MPVFLATPAKPAADTVWDQSLIGVHLGAWQITDRIGRGGMGEVFGAARAQSEFEQRVAILLAGLMHAKATPEVIRPGMRGRCVRASQPDRSS